MWQAQPLNQFKKKRKEKEKLLMIFFSRVPNMQISNVIPGVNIIARKVSIVGINGAGGSRGVRRPVRKF